MMNINVKNCRNIDEANISIEENKLNIKYGLNGTGKSSITSAIMEYINKQNFEDLLPFKYRNLDNCEIKTQISGIPSDYKIMLFNEDYIERFVFQKDELLNNSFEVFFKTDKYEELENNIKTFTDNINQLFVNIPELAELLNVFEIFISNCSLTKKGVLSGSSILKKSLGVGNKLEHIPAELKSYKVFLKSKNNVEWIDWQLKGSEKFRVLSPKCPYCSRKINKETTVKIETLQENYNKTYIKNLNDIITNLKNIKKYLKKDVQSELKKIETNINGLSEQEENLIIEIHNQVSLFYNCLLKLRNLSLENKERYDEFKDYLATYKINLTNFSHFNSVYTQGKVKLINDILNTVQKQSRSLYIALSRQRSYIGDVVSKYQKEIDDFLHFAGFNYHIQLTENKGVSSIHLLQDEYLVSDISKTFSYGEKNAFALVLFMYDALSKSPDLIILDDPISSFDGNKKYAILHRLFLTKNTKSINSLRDKTVMLLTHDISIVVDVVHTGYQLTKDFVRADFLENIKGILSEKPIRNSNIESYLEILNKNIEQSSNDITKLIFLRKKYEIENDLNHEWSLLSSLFHKRKKPTMKISRDEEKPLGIRRTLLAVNSVRKDVDNFSYEKVYENIMDNDYMFTLFINAKSNYEKIQIYRIINNKNHGNSVIEKFINESFHIDNDLLFHLNPLEYETVPDYIIDECKKDLKQKFNLG